MWLLLLLPTSNSVLGRSAALGGVTSLLCLILEGSLSNSFVAIERLQTTGLISLPG